MLPPLATEPLSTEQATQVAPLLKALADPVRLRLLSLVASHEGQEACVCDLTDSFDLSQPTISHHLKVMHEVSCSTAASAGCGSTTRSVARRSATWRSSSAAPLPPLTRGQGTGGVAASPSAEHAGEMTRTRSVVVLVAVAAFLLASCAAAPTRPSTPGRTRPGSGWACGRGSSARSPS